ncbi:hypothetical protein ACIVBQ_003090 [Tenacibaculum discolor]
MKYTILTLSFLLIVCGCKPSQKLVEKKKLNKKSLTFYSKTILEKNLVLVLL